MKDMKKYFTKYTQRLFALTIVVTLTSGMLTSCIEETQPTSVMTSDQVSAMATSQKGMLNGIVGFMLDVNTWGSSGYYTNDWGYPCQMLFREVLLGDIPCYNSTYNYWGWVEDGTEERYYAYYTYRYYYDYLHNVNNLIGVIDPENCTEESLNYLGIALTYRALLYLDMARMFEYRQTSLSAIDDKATELGCWDLTVPIVTPDLTLEQTKNNPRAPFYTMYRFIMNDLNTAEKYLAGFNRGTDNTLPDQSVVYGLKARLYLEMASRFDTTYGNADAQANAAKDLAKMEAAEQANNDGYCSIGASNATQCYEKAAEYAVKAMKGYSPLTKDQWQSTTQGFNTPDNNNSWMWSMKLANKEQLGAYYCTYTATVGTEPTWTMGRGYNAYRLIGSKIYSYINKSDFRRATWLDPNDAGKKPNRNYYKTLLDDDDFKTLPAYANFKFRPNQGDLDDFYTGLLVSLPLMRMEEMEFIRIEAMAHKEAIAGSTTMPQASQELQDWTNNNRVTDGSYVVKDVQGISSFIEKLMIQKRIEFWAEGILYFDYKRLKLQVRRKDNTNYESNYLINSPKDYVCPWFNYFLLDYEKEINVACVMNPDVTGALDTSSPY